MKKNIFYIALILSIIIAKPLINKFSKDKTNNTLPVVAIANYGPHSSLHNTIKGIKIQLEELGYIEGENIQYNIADVGFDTALIPQMISSLKNYNPKAMIVMGTPIAQYAKGKIKNIPLIYSVITDPAEAGLLADNNSSVQSNIIGSSDKQDLNLMIEFAKQILPDAKNIGLLYSSAEANDLALKKMLEQAAEQANISVLAIPIDQTRDIAIRIKEFKHKVDFIYVGTSGAIQPALPLIAAEAKKMHIPLFNAEEQAVKDGLALASFGVNYISVGRNTAMLVHKILQQEDIANLEPTFPGKDDHIGFINANLANEFNIIITEDLTNIHIVK